MALEIPPPDIWVYLDSNVLMDLERALDPNWSPPTDLLARLDENPKAARTDLQYMAAGRLFFYSRKNRTPSRGWYLAVSGSVREEIAQRAGAWTLGVFFDVDGARDAPTQAQIDTIATRLDARPVHAVRNRRGPRWRLGLGGDAHGWARNTPSARPRWCKPQAIRSPSRPWFVTRGLDNRESRRLVAQKHWGLARFSATGAISIRTLTANLTADGPLVPGKQREPGRVTASGR